MKSLHAMGSALVKASDRPLLQPPGSSCLPTVPVGSKRANPSFTNTPLKMMIFDFKALPCDDQYLVTLQTSALQRTGLKKTILLSGSTAVVHSRDQELDIQASKGATAGM